MNRHTRNLQAAQRAYDNQSPDESGDSRDEWIADRRAELLTAYLRDRRKVEEAEAWTAGTLGDSHYTDVALALYDLAGVEPADLLGSGVLERLYRLAATQSAAIVDTLRGDAENRAELEWHEREEVRDDQN